ncbi:MAG: hypothetical protein ACFE9C_16730, partial [Candidatus Hodarchaeota archaeon]
MKCLKLKSLFIFFIMINFCLPLFTIILNENHTINQNSEAFTVFPSAINRTGKVFTNITNINKNCYINQEFPNLNNQPSIFIPNYNISKAKMTFENITAVNYTRSIESDFSEFIFSSRTGPTYIYQKFAVKISQFVNNVSILLQDINNPTSFTDENSWEIALVNCLN